MLNEEKIKLMTKLALYEQKEGSKAFRTNKFYKADYISMRMIYTAILATISYMLLLLIWIIYKVDFLMQNINKINYWLVGIILALIYIVFLVFYLILSYQLFLKKYKSIKKNLIDYNANLKQLHKMYKMESKIKEGKDMEGSDNVVEPFDI